MSDVTVDCPECPKLFNALADAVELSVKRAGAQFLRHYLDYLLRGMHVSIETSSTLAAKGWAFPWQKTNVRALVQTYNLSQNRDRLSSYGDAFTPGEISMF